MNISRCKAMPVLFRDRSEWNKVDFMNEEKWQNVNKAEAQRLAFYCTMIRTKRWSRPRGCARRPQL